MRILLYLAAPDIEIVVVVDEPAPKRGAYRGRAVFSADELDAVLDMNPTASDFKVICAAKTALDGTVVHDGVRFATADASGYGDDDALYE